MSEYILRIEKLENGYEVEVFDPKIEAANNKPAKKGAPYNYQSPWKGYAFSTGKEVVEFVGKHLASLPKSDHQMFNEAAAEAFKE